MQLKANTSPKHKQITHFTAEKSDLPRYADREREIGGALGDASLKEKGRWRLGPWPPTPIGRSGPLATWQRSLRLASESGIQLSMRTALQLAEGSLDESERHFLNVIRGHGWFSTRVFDLENNLPDFSYSTGFVAKFGFPEIIIFSLSKEVSQSILWDLWRDVEAGSRPQVGSKERTILGHVEAVLLPVAKSAYPEHLGWSRWFYCGDDFDCLQLVWPDREGKFPWDEGFDIEFAKCQPDLTGGNWKSHPA